jgi:hypothetical protein
MRRLVCVKSYFVAAPVFLVARPQRDIPNIVGVCVQAIVALSTPRSEAEPTGARQGGA